MGKSGMIEGNVGKIILVMIVVFVILFLFRNAASGAIRSIDPVTAEASLKACKQGYLGIGADPDKTCTPKLGDADGDCYPDSCDTCPDVHNELIDYSKVRAAIEAKYPGNKEKIEEILGDISNNLDNPDVDHDFIPNICEATKQQIYDDKKKVWNRVALADIEIPYKDGRTAICKFWYSHDQCCAREGSRVEAFGINGELTTFHLEKPCLPHDNRPGK